MGSPNVPAVVGTGDGKEEAHRAWAQELLELKEGHDNSWALQKVLLQLWELKESHGKEDAHGPWAWAWATELLELKEGHSNSCPLLVSTKEIKGNSIPLQPV